MSSGTSAVIIGRRTRPGWSGGSGRVIDGASNGGTRRGGRLNSTAGPSTSARPRVRRQCSISIQVVPSSTRRPGSRVVERVRASLRDARSVITPLVEARSVTVMEWSSTVMTACRSDMASSVMTTSLSWPRPMVLSPNETSKTVLAIGPVSSLTQAAGRSAIGADRSSDEHSRRTASSSPTRRTRSPERMLALAVGVSGARTCPVRSTTRPPGTSTNG